MVLWPHATRRSHILAGLALWMVIGSGVASSGTLWAGPITYANAVLADNPIGYWRLGESSGTTALNSSAFGRNGTYNGGVTLGLPGAIPADSNTAAGFNGSTAFVSVAGSPFNLANNFTLEAWVINDNTVVRPPVAPRIFSNRTFSGVGSADERRNSVHHVRPPGY